MNHQSMIGPTATPTEHKLLTTEAGNIEVEKIQHDLKRNIERRFSHQQHDITNLTKLQQDETEAFEVLNKRGLRLDIDEFTYEMNDVIRHYQQQGKTKEAHQQTLRRDKILQMHPQTCIIHPTFSTRNSRTGRITVSKPALQSWKSAVRAALSPSDQEYPLVYSLDCSAYDPTIMAVLSKDENLIRDLKADDFYMKLLQQTGHVSLNQSDRDDIKRLFLACFINGGDVKHHLKNSRLSLTIDQWKKIEERYSKAARFRDNINQLGTANSLNGITYRFKPNDSAKFAKFIQHESAYIFRHIFMAVFKREISLNMQVILPVHDEILIAVKATENVEDITDVMKDQFQEVTGASILRIKATPVRGEEYA